MDEQQKCDAFYSTDNVVTVAVEMPDADWETLRNAEPHGGRCVHSFTGDRYDWFEAPRIFLSASVFPEVGPSEFASVGLKKRSYCGSFSKHKPSLALNLKKFNSGNESVADQLIGTTYLTFNNSKQDGSFIRQVIGYQLFKSAGLPFSRCNLGLLTVNGESLGVYINVEPVRKRHIQHNFNGNVGGNLYEIERGEDLTLDTVESGRASFEGFSDFDGGKDFALAARAIAEQGASALNLVIDLDQFLRFFAMEVVLKHWDGYAHNLNNAFVYNDMPAVSEPSVDDVNFKFIPWGLDQILQPRKRRNLYDEAIVADLIKHNTTLRTRVEQEIATIVESVFSAERCNKEILPTISKLESLLHRLGQRGVSKPIRVVREQIFLIGCREGWLGNRNTKELHHLSDRTGQCQVGEILECEFFQTPEDALSQGYDGCYFCLRRLHTR